jgi:hypothetical protein
LSVLHRHVPVTRCARVMAAVVMVCRADSVMIAVAGVFEATVTARVNRAESCECRLDRRTSQHNNG